MAATTEQTQPKTYTFYYEFIHVDRTFRIEVQKTLEDIPVAYRAEFLRKIESKPAKGTVMHWPFNPSQEEVDKMEEQTPCPHCGKFELKYIWPLAD